jgi:alpha-methylacyl-CoA racemase
LIADLAGAERAVSATLGLLLRRARGGGSAQELVSLRDSAVVFAEPLVHGMTTEAGFLGGSTGIYRIYQARDGWVSVGALEPHFAARLGKLLGSPTCLPSELTPAFTRRTMAEWVEWGAQNDLPISAVTKKV